MCSLRVSRVSLNLRFSIPKIVIMIIIPPIYRQRESIINGDNDGARVYGAGNLFAFHGDRLRGEFPQAVQGSGAAAQLQPRPVDGALQESHTRNTSCTTAVTELFFAGQKGAGILIERLGRHPRAVARPEDSVVEPSGHLRQRPGERFRAGCRRLTWLPAAAECRRLAYRRRPFSLAMADSRDAAAADGSSGAL